MNIEIFKRIVEEHFEMKENKYKKEINMKLGQKLARKMCRIEENATFPLMIENIFVY